MTSRRRSDGRRRPAPWTGCGSRGWGQRGTTGAAIPSQLGFENVVQDYGAMRALDGVSLTIAPGELVCLLGHSGCGKTTLLRVAAGVEEPTSGRVLHGRARGQRPRPVSCRPRRAGSA